MASVVDALMLNIPKNIIPQSYVLRMAIQIVIQKYNPIPHILEILHSIHSIHWEARKKEK